MRPDKRFLKQPKHFWANVRSVSQHIGYTERGAGRIKVPTLEAIADALRQIGLKSAHVIGEDGHPTELGSSLLAYFEYRAGILYDVARPHLMDAKKARAMFRRLKSKLKPKWNVPLNKQKGPKRAEAYFTGIINMLIEAHCEGLPCDYSPMELTSVTVDGAPLRTLARWVDGAFP